MRNTKWIVISLVLILALTAAAVGGWFWYDNNVDRSGWEDVGGSRHYKDFYGDRVTGWLTIDGNRYYFTGDTSMATQWHEVQGKLYFFGEDGVMATGWQEIAGNTYYFDEEGICVQGWLDHGGNRYYLPEGVLATGWQEIDGKRYYFDEAGVMTTGTLTLDGIAYSFQEDGTMATGWVSGRYFLSDGTVATGRQEIDGKQYLFNQDGTCYTGWLEDGEYRYYYQADGSAAVGPVEIDGYTYHFSPGGIQVWLVNSQNLLPEFYEPTLVLSEGTYMDESCVEAFTQMVADCRAAGQTPEVMVGYRSYWDQHFMYFNKLKEAGPNGALYVAAPNASEHQLGLAVDIVESGNYVMNNAQEYTGTFKWMQEHCWDYGFIIRYPNDTTEITGIAYEPWHYRYVGKEVAMELKELGITLEEYLGTV